LVVRRSAADPCDLPTPRGGLRHYRLHPMI